MPIAFELYFTTVGFVFCHFHGFILILFHFVFSFSHHLQHQVTTTTTTAAGMVIEPICIHFKCDRYKHSYKYGWKLKTEKKLSNIKNSNGSFYAHLTISSITCKRMNDWNGKPFFIGLLTVFEISLCWKKKWYKRLEQSDTVNNKKATKSS